MPDEQALRRLVRPGALVAVGDGAGLPADAVGTLASVAGAVGDVDLLLGWVPGRWPDVDLSPFRSVRALMGGYGLRRLIDDGRAAYLPVRLGTVPALLRDRLRPAVLVASVRRAGDGGWRFTTEVAWQRAAVDAGAMVAAVERPACPCADAGPALPDDRLVVVASSPAPPEPIAWSPARDHDGAMAERIAALVPPGARLQVAPGALGHAVLAALTAPVHLDTGALTDAVVDLDERGLLAGAPVTPYLTGSARLYEWADGRGVVDRFERTHDPVRLSSGPPFVAVNTALQVDLDGQVNVTSVGGSAIAGIGGQPDYAYAAARSIGGLSIVATRTTHAGRSTLVDRLDAPASTPAHDVDVVVTELGAADLRGLDGPARRRAIATAWGH